MESRADFREREGLILSQCRLESGLSQEYVARQMDVNIRTVRNWEDGLSPIRNDDLLMWFTVCKQSPWRWLQRIWMPSAFSDTDTPNWTDEQVDKAVIQNYRIDTVTGDDPCPESIKPGFDRLQICLQAGEAAVLAGNGEYNAREK